MRDFRLYSVLPQCRDGFDSAQPFKPRIQYFGDFTIFKWELGRSREDQENGKIACFVFCADFPGTNRGGEKKNGSFLSQPKLVPESPALLLGWA